MGIVFLYNIIISWIFNDLAVLILIPIFQLEVFKNECRLSIFISFLGLGSIADISQINW